jgi:hypothetical protein
MIGRLTSLMGVALLLGAAGATALAGRNLLVALRMGGTTEDRIVAAYNAPGILTNVVIAVALLVFGIGLLRTAQHRRVSRLTIGALGLLVLVLMAYKAGWL